MSNSRPPSVLVEANSILCQLNVGFEGGRDIRSLKRRWPVERILYRKMEGYSKAGVRSISKREQSENLYLLFRMQCLHKFVQMVIKNLLDNTTLEMGKEIQLRHDDGFRKISRNLFFRSFLVLCSIHRPMRLVWAPM